jgi:GMP synthase-like glutamine amidotransferase
MNPKIPPKRERIALSKEAQQSAYSKSAKIAGFQFHFSLQIYSLREDSADRFQEKYIKTELRSVNKFISHFETRFLELNI